VKKQKPLILSKASPHKSAAQFRDMKHPNLICFQDEFLTWNGCAYDAIDPPAMKSQISAFLADAKRMVGVNTAGTAQPVDFNPKKTDVEEVYTALQRICHKDGGPNDVQPPMWLDGRSAPAPEDIISCKNGLLDLITGDLLDHTPAFFTRTSLPIEFNELAPDPVAWRKFLNEITDNDPAMIDLIKELFGYFLTSDMRMQIILLLHGNPGSGKDTLLSVLHALVGERNIANPSVDDFGGQFALQSFVAKLLAILGDANTDDKKALSKCGNRMKAISGETPQDINRKFLSVAQVKLRTRIIFVCNDLPDFGNSTHALGRRLITLPLTQDFRGNPDIDLKEKLQAELPGILNDVLGALRRLRERGKFIVPAKCLWLKDRILYLSNPARGFFDKECIADPNAETKKMDVYERYHSFSVSIGVHPVSFAKFAEELYKFMPTVRAGRQTEGGERENMFMGVRLKPQRFGSSDFDEAPPTRLKVVGGRDATGNPWD